MDVAVTDDVLKLLRRAMAMQEKLAARELAKAGRADPKRAAAFMLNASQIGKMVADIEDRRGIVTSPKVTAIEVTLVSPSRPAHIAAILDENERLKSEVAALRRRQQGPTVIDGECHSAAATVPALPAPTAANETVAGDAPVAPVSTAPQQSAAPTAAPSEPLLGQNMTYEQRAQRIAENKKNAGDRPQGLRVPFADYTGNRGLVAGQSWRRFDFPDHGW